MELLLEEGADVNAPAKGSDGATALQAVCARFLTFDVMDENKLKIIELLLARGADVNAAPARKMGLTALQATARTGDLAVAKVLLLNNPMADVNAPPCQDGGLGTALDIAARFGRLDMAKLLLSYNALSGRHGETGYDGAISIAEEIGYLAVADLIRGHAKDDQRLPVHLRNPCLSEPPRHWSEYGYTRDSDEDSERSYGTESAESDETDDESDSSPEKDTSMTYEVDEREETFTVQDIHSVVYPDAKQASEAVYHRDVQNSTQPFTADIWPTATTLDTNSWADQRDLGLELEGHDGATLRPMYAPLQMDFGTSMDLDVSMGSDIG